MGLVTARVRLATSLLATLGAFALAPVAPGLPLSTDSAAASVQLRGNLPSPRSRTSAVWANGSAYIFGGRTGAPGPGYSSTRDIVRFTPGGTTSVVGQLPPTPMFAGTPTDGREDTAAIWTGERAYIFGGYDASAGPLDEIIEFNPSTGEARVVGRLPLGTAGASAVWDGESAYILGGYVRSRGPSQPPPPPGQPPPPNDPPPPPPTLSSQIVRFTPGGSATTLGTRLPRPTNHAAAVVTNPVTGPNSTSDPIIYIYGGHDGRNAIDEIVEFQPGTGIVRIAGRMPSPRHDASAIWLPDKSQPPPGNPFASQTGNAFVFGGATSSQDDNATDEIVAHDPVYDPDGGRPPVEVVDRLKNGTAHVSAVASDSVGGYLFGGETGPGNRALRGEIFRFTRPIRYAALGDSYSSGEGLGEQHGPYLQGGNPACHRHPLAYPRLFEFNGPTRLDFYACSGARTEHVYRDQQYFEERDPGGPDVPQEAGRNELTGRTDLVSLTIGGNDVGKPNKEGIGGLSEPLRFCLTHNECQKNAKFVAQLRSNIDKVGANLRPTIVRLKERTGPDTAIYLLGYPRVFPTDSDPVQRKREQNCKSLVGRVPVPPDSSVRVGWTAGEQTFLNGALDRLNDQALIVAAAAGIRFVDVTERFSGHAICDEGEGGSWISALGIKLGGKPGLKTSSFHPNLEGQAAYAQALRGAIDLATGFIEQGAIPGRLTPVGLPANPEPASRPFVELNPVRTVTLGKPSRFSGTIGDDFGIARATLSFGDGSRRNITIPGTGGGFEANHRYRKAGRYEARLTVVGNEGVEVTAKQKLRVKPKKTGK